MKKIRNIQGFDLEYDGDKIISISAGSTCIRVEDEVISNGRFGAPEGTRGKVVRITEPGVHSTSDCIDVKFWEDRSPMAMKFKDLNLREH